MKHERKRTLNVSFLTNSFMKKSCCEVKPVSRQVRFHCWPAVSLLKYVLQSFLPTSRGSVFCGRYSVLICLTKQRHTSLIIIHRRGSTSQSAIVGECACAATMPTRVEPIIVCATVSPEGVLSGLCLWMTMLGAAPAPLPPCKAACRHSHPHTTRS